MTWSAAIAAFFNALLAAFGFKKDRDTQQAADRQAAIDAAEKHTPPPTE